MQINQGFCVKKNARSEARYVELLARPRSMIFVVRGYTYRKNPYARPHQNAKTWSSIPFFGNMVASSCFVFIFVFLWWKESLDDKGSFV